MSDSLQRQLSDAAIRKARPESKPYKMTDGGGLFLLVQTNGARLWRYKFRVHGREGLIALGAYPEVSLADVRELHRAARNQVAAGVNPVHARQAERELAARQALEAKAGTWEAAVAEWRRVTDPHLAECSVKQRARELQRHLVALKGRQMKDIRRSDIAREIQRVDEKTPAIARNLRGYLWAIFEHSIDTGLIDANPVPSTRIMRRHQKRRQPALPIDQLADFLAAVDGSGAEPATKAAMRLIVLTAVRKTEVTSARWDEFDLDAASWVIPAGRIKGRREHWVPLSRQAVELLRERRRQTNGDVVFPHRDREGQPLSGNVLNMLLGRIGYKTPTVHGFRSVFSTRYNALSPANADVVERCLAHVSRDQVRAAYNRHDYAAERIAMMQDWADYIDAAELARMVKIAGERLELQAGNDLQNAA